MSLVDAFSGNEVREVQPGPDQSTGDDEDVLLMFLNVALRRRRVIAMLMLTGAIAGLSTAILSPRHYVSRAAFQPQSSPMELSGLTKAASEFGFQVPAGLGEGWGPGIYLDLLRSRNILELIVVDTFEVREGNKRRAPLTDLLGVEAGDSSERVEQGVIELRRLLRVRELMPINAVEIEVSTRWPNVSREIAQRLVASVHRFNRIGRRSQAKAEREFVDARAEEALADLRAAEDRLQAFVQRNRTLAGSPELLFERDRLQRELTLRQGLYTRLVEARESARLREIRDTPVITMLEDPGLPALPESPRVALSSALGMLAGGLIGLAAVLLQHALRAAEHRADPSEYRFLALLKGMLVPFNRGRAR